MKPGNVAGYYDVQEAPHRLRIASTATGRHSMTKLRLSAVALVTLFAGCGGSDGPTEPPPPVVSSVTVTPTSATLDQGATVQFQASAKDASGNTVSGQTVTWASSAAGVATISGSGLATGVASGTTAITATVAGVAGSAVLTVTQSLCSNPTTVSLSPGQTQSFASSDCLLIPSGATGDRYRVTVLRPNATGTASDVAQATLKVVGVGVSQAAPVPAPMAAASFVPLPGFTAEDARKAIRVAEATERFHARLREQEVALLGTMDLPALRSSWVARELAARAPQAAAPAKTIFDTSTSSSCATTPEAKKTALLIHETDDLVFYQDSTQNATNPLSVALATQMGSYYSSYSRSMIEEYFGTPSDIDGNGKVTVFVTPIVKDEVAAFVWSGDFFDNDTTNINGCAASNEQEIIYFNLDLIQAMDEGAYQALETLAHEMKHVVSLYNRIAASIRLKSAQYHPTWIEEGTAEIAGEMSARIAWAAIGGPAVGSQVTRQSFVNTSGGIVPENYGVAIKLARTAWYLASQPNGLVVTPDGALDGSSIYGSGWLFHRWLGDAYGHAASALHGDASLFRALNDSMAARGTTGIENETGKPFLDLVDEFFTTASLHRTWSGTVARDFTTYDFVSAAEIFCNPNPLGVFPWPVTTTGTVGDCEATPRVSEVSNPSAGFQTKEYTGSLGPSGVRIHDFLSNGTGTGAQITLSTNVAAKILVTRIR